MWGESLRRCAARPLVRPDATFRPFVVSSIQYLFSIPLAVIFVIEGSGTSASAAVLAFATAAVLNESAEISLSVGSANRPTTMTLSSFIPVAAALVLPPQITALAALTAASACVLLVPSGHGSWGHALTNGGWVVNLWGAAAVTAWMLPGLPLAIAAVAVIGATLLVNATLVIAMHVLAGDDVVGVVREMLPLTLLEFIVCAPLAIATMLASRESSWAPLLFVAPVLATSLMTRQHQRLGVVTQELEREATAARRDPLTGLLNRRGFDEQIAGLVENDRHASDSILVIDVDHFKRFNDEYGHETGDCVLVETAREIERATGHLRCVIARFGGEEFVVFAAAADARIGGDAAERVRMDVESTLADLGVTVSIGVASAGLGPPVDVLLRTADAALYAAKEAGRNCAYAWNARTGVAEPVVRDATSASWDEVQAA